PFACLLINLFTDKFPTFLKEKDRKLNIHSKMKFILKFSIYLPLFVLTIVFFLVIIIKEN
ncbi:unnamed protein product, partial [marine sediment metagenome]